MDLDFAPDGNLRELSVKEAWEAIENFAQGQKEWDNPPKIISKQELTSLRAQAKRVFGNENVWVKMPREVPSFDEPEPQPNPLPNSPPFDISLGDKRGPKPPIKPHGQDSFRMKEVDNLMRFLALGWHLEEIHVTWAHLEKKRTRLQTYTKSLEELCI
ncbi:hypothetical protein Tco_1001046 [Tanacetum coccineum]